MLERPIAWARGFGFLRLALITIAALILGYAAYTVIDRLFFAPAESKKQEATMVVAKEQAKAEEVITVETLETLQEREVFRDETRNKVSRGQGKVNAEVSRQRTPGRPANEVAVHRAGELALCELHHSYCNDAGPEAVQ